MDNNDQRRQERSWNDPPMFSMEQLNNASNTVPLNKRYRYPQQPQTMGTNQMSNYSANYPQPPSTIAAPTPYGDGNYPNSQMIPNQQQPYPSYGPSGTFSNYPPQWPQNYNYPPQQPIQKYPSTQAYSSAPVSSYTTSAPTAVSSTVTTFNNNDSLPIPGPYGSSDPVQSNTIVTNQTPAAPIGFNYNQLTQLPPPPPAASMMMNTPRVPGFNYGIPQQQYSRYQ